MRIPFLLTVSLFFLSVEAWAQPFLWPMAGHSAGENILSKPQEYIFSPSQEQMAGELNFDELFIGGKEGDAVLCPVDGIIAFVGIDYFQSLVEMVGTSVDPALTLDENIRALSAAGKLMDPRYHTGSLSIRLSDGTKVHLTGLTGPYRFKTGQKVSPGDTLGLLGYAYKSIKDPSLSVSFSDKNGKPLDPMTPFGLPSTFVAPKALTRDYPMSIEKAKEDLTVLEESICELYPSLKDRMPEEEFRSFMDSLKQTVTVPVDPASGFRTLIRKVLRKVPDSHMYLMQDPIQDSPGDFWRPTVFLSWCDDTLRVLAAQAEYKELEGKCVSLINGISPKDFASRADAFVTTYDDKVESTKEDEKILLGNLGILMNPGATKESAYDLVFEDGSEARIPFSLHPRIPANPSYFRIARWRRINAMRNDSDVFVTRTLNDSTAYLGIKTFEMMDTQVEQILAFSDTCQAENLVVDVRNNAGGSSDVLMRLLSCFTDTPMERQKGGYNRVNKQGQFSSLGYSLNRNAKETIFPEYTEEDGGFVYRDTVETCSVVLPDPAVHYDGRVYVLTNGYSFSAATLFPAVLVRNRRGVSVGRETGSGYHYMTALKFADIRLPNSLQTVRIPMVQLVFDTTVCDRLPEGRGLLPDYPFPLTWNEVMNGPEGETDVMLDYALSLIADGKYLSEGDPFAAVDSQPVRKGRTGLLLLIPLLIIALAVAVWFRKRRTA